MVGVRLIVLVSSSTPYAKVPRLVLRKTNRLTQAVVVSEGIFCAARCCVIFHLQNMKFYLHRCPTGMFSGTFYAQHSITKNLHISPRLWPKIFYQDANSVLRLCTSTLLYSSIIRLYPQNPVLKIVHDKSVKVYLLVYNDNVQQNPLCVESCVTKKCSMSPLFSSTIFDPDANSVLLRAHLCTAVGSMRRKPFVRFFIKMQIQYSY